MEEFTKLRDIALPLSTCFKDSIPLTSELKAESKSNDVENSPIAVQNTSDIKDKNKDLDFLSFAEQLIRLNDKDLNTVLEDIDARHKVTIHDPKTDEVVTATETLVTGILQAAGDLDPRFKSSCIHSGSFYDDLKVGSADEFDFVARIDSLSQKDVLEARKSERKRGFVYLVVKDKVIQEQFEEFLTEPDDDPCLENTDVILNVNSFQEYFIELLHSAIKTIDIPDNFFPTDKFDESAVRKDSWRPNLHGPCATLYLTYICETTPDVVDIDIDIAPSIAYPGKEYVPPVIEKLATLQPSNPFLDSVHDIIYASEVMLVPFRFDYTEKSSENSWHYCYSDTWRVSHSTIEKAIFSLFKSDDTEEKLCRILKILKEIYLQGTTETEDASNSGHLKLLEPPSTRLSSCTVEAISCFSNELEHDTDLESDSDDDEYETVDEDEDDEINEMLCEGEVSEDGLYFKGEYADQLKDKSGNKCDGLTDENAAMLHTDESNGSVTSNSCQTEGTTEHSNISPLEDNTLQDEDQVEKIIYSRVPKIQSADLPQVNTATGRNSNDDSDNTPAENNIRPLSYSIDQVDFASSPSSNNSDNYHVVGECRRFTSQQSNQCAVAQILQDAEVHQTAEINYRDSKPLLKTYMIKMLFLAMKTAYPETERWEPKQLSALLKMALCMIYYAYCSEEKGILNFWFQDLIENRTRDSTCKEVLFCLKRLVHILSRNIQNCNDMKYK